jgi:hypothetical protein
MGLMTHAEFRRAHRAAHALEPTECKGELDLVESHELQIDVYRCRACGRTLSCDARTGLLLNDYADPRQMARDLAGKIHVAGSGEAGRASKKV